MPAPSECVRVSASQQLIDSSEIRSMMLEMSQAFKAQDLDAVMECYADDADLTVVGSYDVTCRGKEELRKVFEKEFREQEPSDITPSVDVKVVSYGVVAWVSARTTRFVKGDEKLATQRGRFTSVLEKHDGRWKVIHSHFSIPMAYEETGSKRGKGAKK